MLKEMMGKKMSDYTGGETMIYAGIFIGGTIAFSGLMYLCVVTKEHIEKKHEEKKLKKEKENN